MLYLHGQARRGNSTRRTGLGEGAAQGEQGQESSTVPVPQQETESVCDKAESVCDIDNWLEINKSQVQQTKVQLIMYIL